MKRRPFWGLDTHLLDHHHRLLHLRRECEPEPLRTGVSLFLMAGPGGERVPDRRANGARWARAGESAAREKLAAVKGCKHHEGNAGVRLCSAKAPCPPSEGGLRRHARRTNHHHRLTHEHARADAGATASAAHALRDTRCSARIVHVACHTPCPCPCPCSGRRSRGRTCTAGDAERRDFRLV